VVDLASPVDDLGPPSSPSRAPSTLHSPPDTHRHRDCSSSTSGRANSSFGGAGLRCSSVQAALSYANMELVHPIPSHLLWFSYNEKVKRTPVDPGLRFVLRDLVAVFAVPSGDAGVLVVLGALDFGGTGPKVRPVILEQILRTVDERQSIVRDIRAGRECQVRRRVPAVSTTRCVVMIRNGGAVRPIQNGVMRTIRRKRLVKAGLVVADVAVR
jgi:hypothetical protein